MRITLMLEDDLADLLNQQAHALDLPFNEVVNRVIRAGLKLGEPSQQGAPPKTTPHSFGFKPGIDLDKLGQLGDGEFD